MVLFRLDGVIYALDNACLHQGDPLGKAKRSWDGCDSAADRGAGWKDLTN